MSLSQLTCPGWSPTTSQSRCPATPEEDAAFTAMWTLGWRQLPCGVNSQNNHYCRFQYVTAGGDWQQTYRYYNANGSYYYRGSSNKGFYYDRVKKRQHISTYGANGELTEREYLPMEVEETIMVPVDAFGEIPMEVDE
ncbi:uncharacterized protein PHACADRAFT_207354 [Phanerochaete carnosa HHB-10118-sp]|uniref:Uncharacterized protein n=1 Tax=Phanerochaete carnosa (strain HHB-10118-sp) TaxID=650164 RepID=K5V717_PHACS|nr:uncharacterized protein PHACADRAFT_207354 [Phanerochaete carnosa HHB-10118-sp]EKM58536.1 hypothetical protein PHACADRAFT_207354 [Phanerochaete carnosa HHB-10118-sp]